MLICCEIQQDFFTSLEKRVVRREKISQKKQTIVNSYVGICPGVFIKKVGGLDWQMRSLRDTLKKDLCEKCRRNMCRLSHAVGDLYKRMKEHRKN
jgi:hypothetical protein